AAGDDGRAEGRRYGAGAAVGIRSEPARPPSAVRASADSRFLVVVLVRAHDRPSRPTTSVPSLKSDGTIAGTHVPRIALSANTSRTVNLSRPISQTGAPNV